MLITSQIIGKSRAATVMLFRLKDRLKLVNIVVNFPPQNRLHLKTDTNLTYDPAEMSEEQMLNALFDSIANSSFHVVSNEIGGLIDQSMAKSIIHAFDHKKPVIITNKPFFSAEVPADIRSRINKNLDKIYIQGLLKLNNQDLETFVNQIAQVSVDYK